MGTMLRKAYIKNHSNKGEMTMERKTTILKKTAVVTIGILILSLIMALVASSGIAVGRD
jgi:hypothetical protein